MYIKRDDAVGSIVTRNFQAASVFNAHGIDFYSQGERTLEHACLEDHVSMGTLLVDLCELSDQNRSNPDFAAMDLTDLSVYILRTHHTFAEKKVTFIKHTLERVTENSGAACDIDKIRETFSDLSLYLTVHMKHEEFIIFPSIQKLARTMKRRSSKMAGMIHPIEAMKEDHSHEVATLRRLNELTNDYAVTSNAEYALKIAYDAMKELEDDLKIHMHLENNILFPRAINLASSFEQHLN